MCRLSSEGRSNVLPHTLHGSMVRSRGRRGAAASRVGSDSHSDSVEAVDVGDATDLRSSGATGGGGGGRRGLGGRCRCRDSRETERSSGLSAEGGDSVSGLSAEE